VAIHRIRQGDIFWLDTCRPLHGEALKRRPVVIVTPDSVIEAAPTVLVVACTSTVFLSNATAIELPSRERTPQTRTGLNRRTWAIPAWLLPVPQELLTDYVGHLSGVTMRRLVEAVTREQSK
jgi:mRNA-degrading endonuclease toxin of MazEF toxin-antitoxin module